MACTRGQLDGFCGGVRASANSNPPGALDCQMSGGIGTKPTGPTPRRAISNGGGSAEPVKQAGEVSEVWLPGRDRACVCKMCNVTRSRETSSRAGRRRFGDIQPTVGDIQSCSRVSTRGVGAESLLARRRAAPRRCIRAGREQEGQGECKCGPRGSRWRRAPGGHRSVGGGAAALLRWGGGDRVGWAFRGNGAAGHGWGRCMKCRGRGAAGAGGQWRTRQGPRPGRRLRGRHGVRGQTPSGFGGARAARPGARARRTRGAGVTGGKGRRPYAFGEGGANLERRGRRAPAVADGEGLRAIEEEGLEEGGPHGAMGTGVGGSPPAPRAGSQGAGGTPAPPGQGCKDQWSWPHLLQG